MTEPCVGASVWASGSQVWNGNIGTFTANPMNIPAKIHTWTSLSMSAPASTRWAKLKLWASVWKNRARKATSINAEPNIV